MAQICDCMGGGLAEHVDKVGDAHSAGRWLGMSEP